MQIPSYYSILTAPVRYDHNLNPNEKIMYSEITALSNFHGYCTASNYYFMKLYGKSKSSISHWIGDLKNNGYIKLFIIKNKKGRVIGRKIFTTDKAKSPVAKNCNTYTKKLQHPIANNCKGNTTSKNTTSINRERRHHAQVVSILNVFQQLFVEDPNLTFEHYMNRWIINYSPARIINVMKYAKKNCRTMNPSAIGSYMNGCLKYPMKPKRKTKKAARGDTNDSKYNRDAEKEMFGDDNSDSKYNHKARF